MDVLAAFGTNLHMQILNFAHNKSDIHAFIEKFGDNGLRSLAIAYYQEVRERPKGSPGGLWQFIGLMSLCHPPRHDSADTIQRGFESWGKCENEEYPASDFLDYHRLSLMTTWLNFSIHSSGLITSYLISIETYGAISLSATSSS
ncbi:putative P-type H(+)-exporting transporter [Helianthus annuus]|nr:putative P-type H(+)-exporting transporter [Helianthus annuus]